MTGPRSLQQAARVYASLDASPLPDRMWENMSFEEAMGLPIVDPEATRLFNLSRAYGELLEASLARTDAMLAPCDGCGTATVFCNCTREADARDDGSV